MSFFGRIKKMVSAEANSVLDKYENEIKLCKQEIENMKESVVKADAAYARARAEAMSAKKQVDAEQAKVSSWQEKAVELVKQGKEGSIEIEKAKDLARTALGHKATCEEGLKLKAAHYNEYKANADKFEKQVAALKKTVTELEANYKTLKHRKELSESRARVSKEMSQFQAGSAKDLIERIGKKVDENDSLADAYDQIEEANKTDETKIDEVLAVSKKASVDDELEKMMNG